MKTLSVRPNAKSFANAFNVLKRCYDELGRPAGAPLATWRDAFKPHNNCVLGTRCKVNGSSSREGCRYYGCG